MEHEAPDEPIGAADTANAINSNSDDGKNAAEAAVTADASKALPPETAPPAAGDGTLPMSKNQQKKLKKRAMNEERKKEKKEIKKQERKVAREAKRDLAKASMKAMTDEEHAQWKKERAEKNAARAREKTEKKERLAKALESGQRIVIDLEFPHLMNESEQRSMAHQVAYSYGSNTRSSTPAHLILSGVHGTTQEHLVHAFPGFENWIVTSTEKPYLEHFSDSKNKLVYLTADSPTELQELDPESIYIIGGIVDRNRHKNLCYNKAVEQGIATARLPLGSNKIKLASSMVMCTNHVVDIMLKWMEMKDWDAAFEAVIPTRKRKVGDEGGEGTSKEQKIEGEDAKSGGDDCKVDCGTDV